MSHLKQRVQHHWRDETLTPQGMLLLVFSYSRITRQVSVKAQLHVGLNESGACECMTGLSVLVDVEPVIEFKALSLPLPWLGLFSRCQDPSDAA